jgi:hypothetical protein
VQINAYLVAVEVAVVVTFTWRCTGTLWVAGRTKNVEVQVLKADENEGEKCAPEDEPENTVVGFTEAQWPINLSGQCARWWSHTADCARTCWQSYVGV